ncbi:MAG: glycosyltransferase 87 family protein [Thermoleophilia bacterium]
MTAPSASWSASRADARATAGAVLLACALFVASWLVLHVDRFEPFQIVDTGVYQRYGEAMTAGQLPYRDFRLEYPPGALPMFALPSLAAEDDYRDVFEPIMLALGLLLCGLLVMTLARAGAGPRRLYLAAAFVGVAPLAVGTVVLTRFDLWPAVLLAGALAALAHDRARLGLGLLAVAISAKLYPAVVAPIALAYVWHRQGRREALVGLGVLVGVLLAIFLPFAILSPEGMRYVRAPDRPAAPAREHRRRDPARGARPRPLPADRGERLRLAEPHRRRGRHDRVAVDRAPGDPARRHLGCVRPRPPRGAAASRRPARRLGGGRDRVHRVRQGARRSTWSGSSRSRPSRPAAAGSWPRCSRSPRSRSRTPGSPAATGTSSTCRRGPRGSSSPATWRSSRSSWCC